MFLRKSSLLELPGTLSTIATLILQKVLSLTKHETDRCFEEYTCKSTKDIKQRTRGNTNTRLNFSSVLFGLGMKPLETFLTFSNLMILKDNILDFFQQIPKLWSCCHSWKYCSVDNEREKFSTIIGLIRVENAHELHGDHLEANTRVAFHETHADKGKT